MEPFDEAIGQRLGERVRERRLELGWSQAALAEHIDTSVEYVSMIERGARLPSLRTLITAGRALGLSLDALVGEHGEPADDALVVAARAVPAAIRPYVTRMLLAVAEPPGAPSSPNPGDSRSGRKLAKRAPTRRR